MERFHTIVSSAPAGAKTISNRQVLSLKDDANAVKLLWMYPDVLSLHGGRGDLMALLRFATELGIPMEITRINGLPEEFSVADADMVWFCCGDSTCIPHVIEALMPRRMELLRFSVEGGVLLANGSSGGILATELTLPNGEVIPGLDLLKMHWTPRSTVHGDDLWLRLEDGTEVIGNEIQLWDVSLLTGQDSFGSVLYGRGNCGSGYEGARTKNTIYTGCLGPILVRNPHFAVMLLLEAARHAGITPEITALSPESISMELQATEAAKTFIENKMNK